MNDDELMTSIISFALFLVLIFFFAMALTIRYRKRKKENEVLKAKYALELQKVQTEIQELTLQYISRELHDNLGHVASLIKINLNTINAGLMSVEESKKIQNTKELIRQLISDIKQLSVRLSNDRIVQQGLEAAIEMEVARLNDTGLYSAVFERGENVPVIEQDKALILYRMVQEAINNIVKHSHASRINIRLHYRAQNTVLEIRDNGIGFNVEQASQNSGAGLLNLKSRAELLHATLFINSDNMNGTMISIIL